MPKTKTVTCEKGHKTEILATSVEKDMPTIWVCNVIDKKTGDMCGHTNVLETK